MKYIFATGLTLCLCACQTLKPDSSTGTSGVETFVQDDRKSSAWRSDSFTGTHFRKIRNGELVFFVEQTDAEGGLDVGLSRVDFEVVPVADLPADLIVCSAYDLDLTGEGRWWAGPKISVNWQGNESAAQNGDAWYENYIVDIASTPPQDLDDILTGDYFKGEILSETIIAGATYRHYKLRFHDWWQFWSVRQDYRKSGSLPLAPILDIWSAAGLPQSRRFDGVKANLETYGPLSGGGLLRMNLIQATEPEPDCAL